MAPLSHNSLSSPAPIVGTRENRSMNIVIRRASDADAEVVSLLNADVQSLHASALPERFKPLGPDTFPAIAGILSSLPKLIPDRLVTCMPKSFTSLNHRFCTPGTRSTCIISACGQHIEEEEQRALLPPSKSLQQTRRGLAA